LAFCEMLTIFKAVTMFKIYKRGQGYYTRLYTAGTVAAISAIGCIVLANKLAVVDNAYFRYLVPFAVFGILALAINWIVNYPKIADFMIVAEGEIKKVSWSSRKEIIASTIVVISVVILMAVLLVLADLGFIWLFTQMGIYA
jgi:preprotein translocase subunit SecE